MIKLDSDLLAIALHEPGDGFYRGTRFDRSGVFDSLLFKGVEMCGRWFTAYDPFMHDAVCGPAEEFSPVFLAGGILKIGVGLLSGDAGTYDRFKLYPVLDAGEWSVRQDGGSVLFRHRLDGYYDYAKEVALTGPASFRISHSLCAGIPLDTEVYNHNFFTFGKLAIGPGRALSLPFSPCGSWRAEYDSVGFVPSGIRFSRVLSEGESVWCGGIMARGQDITPYSFRLSQDGISVHASADVPLAHMVFWANHRIACPEPYNSISAPAGETLRWTVSYRIEDDES